MWCAPRFSSGATNSDKQDHLAMVQACLTDIKQRMSLNKMKLNQDKTEAIVISTKQRLRNNPVPMLDIGGEFITSTSAAKNLGMVFDSIFLLLKSMLLVYVEVHITTYIIYTGYALTLIRLQPKCLFEHW